MRVKNWSQFQHYKDRNPPWIKLHHSLLDSLDYFSLTDFSARLLPLIWLIASERDGGLPSNSSLAFRLRISESQLVESLTEFVDNGFLEDADPEKTSDKWPSRYISEKIKNRVFERDEGKCVNCGSVENIEYDHIVPVSAGGTSVFENIQLLCRSCNRSKRAKRPSPAEQLATQKRIARSLETETESETEGDTETEESILSLSEVQNDKTTKVEVETDNTSRVVKSSTLSPAPSVSYEGEQKNDSQRMVALIMSLWDNWPQDQVEPTVMKLRSADMNLSFSQWEEIIREAFRTCEPTKPTNQLHSWLARQVTFWKNNKSREKKQQSRDRGEYTPRRKPIYPPDCDRSMSGLKEMWVPKGMTAWQDGARTVEENLEICYGPNGFSASTPKAHVDRIREVIDAHKAAGLTMELEYEECD